MSYNYDDLLIETVATRRTRLAGALMFGSERLRRKWSDRTRTFIGGVFLAALAAAGCVAVSFVTNLLANDESLQRNRTPLNPTPSVSSTPNPTPSVSSTGPGDRPVPGRPQTGGGPR